MEKGNSRMRALKRQMDTNYDEMSVVNTAKRKLQRELDEQTELNDTLQRENNSLKQRQRYNISLCSAIIRILIVRSHFNCCLLYMFPIVHTNSPLERQLWELENSLLGNLWSKFNVLIHLILS